jgi:hypothetical protein
MEKMGGKEREPVNAHATRSLSMRRTSRSTSDVDVVVSAGSAWAGGDGDIPGVR